MMKVPGSLLALPLCLVALACDPGGGPLPIKDDGGEPREVDAGDPPDEPDAGADAGSDAGTDAGTDGGTDASGEDAGYTPIDSGPVVDAGTDGGGGNLNPGDEAGDLDDPLLVMLPYSATVDIDPEGERDCFAVDVETGGVLTVATGSTSSATCSGADSEVFLYAGGTTDIEAYLDNNDDGGDGTCSLLVANIGPGRYVACVEHYSRTSPSSIYGATVQISFAGFVCGNDVLDPGEECDGVPNCTASCQLDDGVPREDEMGGNNVPGGVGVREMFLDEPVRGNIVPGSDVDWWLLQLPGGLDPGAVVLKMGNIDLGSTTCGAASDVRADIYSGGNVETPAATSIAESPCRVTTLTQVNGDAVFGDETLLVRVSATGDGGAYHLIASYVEGDCGNGIIEPSEECDPNLPPLGADCNEVTCRLLVPANDTCGAATDITDLLPEVGQHLVLAGQTITASDSSEWTGNGSCQTSASDAVHRDVHYTFTAPSDGVFAADLSTSWDAALYLTEGACETPVRCSDPGYIEEFVTAGQTYTLVVDGYSNANGRFELDVEFLPAPENNTCETAIDVTAELPIDGTKLTIAGDTRAASHTRRWSSGCNSSSSNAPDVFYSFTAAQTGRIFLDLDSPSFDAVLYTFEGVCVTAGSCNDSPEELMIDVVQGQTYTVVVDGYSTTGSGAFTLDMFYVFPPPNDQCDDVTPVDLPADGTPVVQVGDNRFASNDAAVSECYQSGSTHKDTFHVFTAPMDGTVEVVVNTPSWDAMVYAWDGCGGTTELECSDPESFTVPVTAGQRLVVVVDGYSTGSGEYTITARYDIPPPFLGGGDTCQEATPLPGPAGLIQGTLDGATANYDADVLGDCANGYASLGPDVVYSITLQPGETLNASYDGDASGNDESILLLDSCPAASNSCVDGDDSGAPETLSYTHTGSTPHTYFIVIDEYGSSSWSQGTFELSWSVTGP